MEPLSHAGRSLGSPFHGADHHLARRTFLKLAGLSGLCWLTPVSHLLAQQAEQTKSREPAQSIILLWMQGGPSQLETFDPHPDTYIAGGTRAIATRARGVQVAAGFDRLAEHMNHVTLVRSVVSKEGDHERGTALLKTGYRPDPTTVYPSLGAICCHELSAGATEIPRHVSILPGAWPGRGGFLGDEYDAFKTYDPINPVPDVRSRVSSARDEQRVLDMEIVEKAFLKGRERRVDATLHRQMFQNARTMMTTEQLKAFEVSHEPAAVRAAYGDTPFGRGCLAARRLIEVGVRCVEVTLDGWDTHADNHNLVRRRVEILDPAFSALLADLKERDLLRKTIVVCCGEFGRTPVINPLGGRDHWPKGFTIALAGGSFRGGHVHGATDPAGKKEPSDPVSPADIHATILRAVGLNPHKENISPIGRPIKLSEGKAVASLLA